MRMKISTNLRLRLTTLLYPIIIICAFFLRWNYSTNLFQQHRIKLFCGMHMLQEIYLLYTKYRRIKQKYLHYQVNIHSIVRNIFHLLWVHFLFFHLFIIGVVDFIHAKPKQLNVFIWYFIVNIVNLIIACFHWVYVLLLNKLFWTKIFWSQPLLFSQKKNWKKKFLI